MKKLMFGKKCKKFLMITGFLVPVIFYFTAFSLEMYEMYRSEVEESLKTREAIKQAAKPEISLPQDVIRKIALDMIGDFLQEASDRPLLAAVKTFKEPSTIASVAFSPDGKTVAIGSWDNIAKIWDTRTGEVLRTFAGHTDVVTSVAFSPDGKAIVTGSWDKTAKIWDIETGKVLLTFAGHIDPINSVAFSRDGTKVVTGSLDNTAKIWDVTTGTIVRELGHNQEVTSVAFSPDGTKVVTGTTGYITADIWDIETGEVLETLEGHDGSIHSVAFSPDGTKVVTGSADHTAKIWDVTTGTILQTLVGHDKSIHSVAFSPDGKTVVTGSADHTAKIWDVTTGTILQTLVGHDFQVTSVAFSPDGKTVVTGSADKTAKIWTRLLEAKQWISEHISLDQANLIARAFKATKEKKQFIIKTGTDDAVIWGSFPNDVREYLLMYLTVELKKSGWFSWW